MSMTRQFKVTVNGREYDVAVLEVTPGASAPAPAAYAPAVEPVASTAPAARPVAATAPAPVASSSGDEVAQMGGVVVQVDVKLGQSVAIGERLLVLEAMKMKNHLLASRAGQVTRILVAAGDAVEGGQARC
jgi:biotin carboxyl carrier protein